MLCSRASNNGCMTPVFVLNRPYHCLFCNTFDRIPVIVMQNEASSMSKAGMGKLQNLSVTVQRRWNNVLADSTRQLIIEMVFGVAFASALPFCALPLH